MLVPIKAPNHCVNMKVHVQFVGWSVCVPVECGVCTLVRGTKLARRCDPWVVVNRWGD